MAGAMACFTSNDAIIKLLSADVPVGQILFLRSLMIVLAIAFLLRRPGARPPLRAMLDRRNLGRGVFEVAITFCFLHAIAQLPLATATTLIFAAPIFLTLLARLILKEGVGPYRWSAVLAGFLGVVIIVGPRPEGFTWVLLLPLLAALGTAGRDILTRSIPPALPARAITLASSSIVCLAGLATWPLGWARLAAVDLVLIAVCAGLIGLAMTLLITALRLGEMSFLAPVRYVSILLAVAYGWMIWGEVPGWHVALGALIIVASSLVIVHREQRRARTARRPVEAG